MFKKGSKMYSIVNMTCPQCQEGEFFVSSAYNLKKVGETHVHCPKCNLKYAKEPGFYYGAMYVSYAYGVALFTAIIVLYWLAFRRFDVWNLLMIMGVLSILLAPAFYHSSKIVWANFFISYDKDAIAKFEKEKRDQH